MMFKSKLDQVQSINKIKLSLFGTKSFTLSSCLVGSDEYYCFPFQMLGSEHNYFISSSKLIVSCWRDLQKFEVEMKGITNPLDRMFIPF